MASGTGVGTFTQVAIDSLLFDGSNVGLSSDTNLIALANDLLTVNGDLVLATQIDLRLYDGDDTKVKISPVDGSIATILPILFIISFSP